ncbi:Bardet-Biedl syndrome 10 protein homolog [Actinia tenebrosa]|uniref:Bardet-Biedl syndrome 10 protein homolog n=1 Tax=Actinia tenebrosa TaxID=6105 RepID=A0A6P8IWB2_ACTTE|nr:Bardet-Biedl syndrome 10 protein homolog [Actinia tenebrosa]
MATIFEALKSCEYLESVLRDSFGPCGLDVMLNSSSGSILITNSGGVVLNSLNIENPLGRVIVDKMKSHSFVTGDGVTSFIIVVIQALKEIIGLLEMKEGIGELELKPQSWQTIISLSKAFYKIANDVAPDNISPVLNKVAIHTNLEPQNKDEIKQKLTQLIKTTLNGKFSVLCQDLFTSLLIDFISNTCKLGHELYQGIIQALDDFSHFCTEFHGTPVQNSCVIQGFAIPRQFATNDKQVLPKSGKNVFTFLIIHCSLDDVKLTADVVTFNIKNETMLGKALSHKRNIVFSILQSLKEQDIQLIISSEGVSDMVLQLCQQFNIAVIQMVPMETVSHLCKYGNVQPLCHHDLFELKNLSDIFLGKGKFCKEKALGVHKFVHLEIDKQVDSNHIVPYLILLCAPTQGLCQQYYIALHNALKSIKMSFSDNRLHLIMLPGCGSVEFLLANEFGKYAKATKDKNLSLAYSVLSKSLLQVPHTLHKNSHSCTSRDKNFLRVQQEVKFSFRVDGSVLGVNGTTGCVIDPYRKGIFEPLNGKMLWISHILQCLSMILRVERIISVKSIVRDDEKESSDSEE